MAPAGSSHPRVRQFVNIKHNRAPNHGGALALEGLWAIGHALDAGVEVEVVFVCVDLLRGEASVAALDALRQRGALVLEVSERVMRRLVDRDGPDGLAAIAHLPARRLGDVDIGATSRVVIADALDLAGNLGTLIRCADGAGAAAVVVTDRRVRMTHPLVLKASMATLLSMPVVDARRDEALAWLRGAGFRIVAADPAAAVSYRDAAYGPRVAIVLGSERHGLARFWRDNADVAVSIPMLGVADSLNVGHAAALLLYEALAQQQH